jgi:hypothetical protein
LLSHYLFFRVLTYVWIERCRSKEWRNRSSSRAL